MNRRFFLRGLSVLGCSAAAHPMMTSITMAQSPSLGDQRLLVIILRGAMDGLQAVSPVGDKLFATYRPHLTAASKTLDLDGYFALSADLGGLMDLWGRKQLAFAHAVSTPYRDKRSHFEGQDMLEAGTGMDVPVAAVRDGWLNRMLQAMPGLDSETAYAVGGEALPLLSGRAPTRSWTPDQRLDLSAQSKLLLEHIYHDHPLFQVSATEAMELAAEIDLGTGLAQPAADSTRQTAEFDHLADFAADRLRGATRIAAFSLSGWDTHQAEQTAFTVPANRLERMILRLRDQLGPVWDKTTILAVTEFGRTVAENGTKGTDHGTAGVMLMAGGAIHGGKVMGKWPGLDEASLYDRRDLMPTSDVRAWAAWVMRDLYGFDRQVLETAIFPGLQMGTDPGIFA